MLHRILLPRLYATALCLAAMAPAVATTYTLATPADSVVGGDKSATTVYEDTLYDLARTYSLGSEEIIRVNPGVDPWIPGAGSRSHSSQRLGARAKPGPQSANLVDRTHQIAAGRVANFSSAILLKYVHAFS